MNLSLPSTMGGGHTAEPRCVASGYFWPDWRAPTDHPWRRYVILFHTKAKLVGIIPCSLRREFRLLMRVERNNVNVFPHSTFNWVVIDGTQVLCHMTQVGRFPRSSPERESVHVLVHRTRTTRRRPRVALTRQSRTIKYFYSLSFQFDNVS
jgi:hypothetical protein